MRRVLVAGSAALVVALGGFVASAPAAADDTVVVHGLDFTAGSLTNLAVTGCPALFERAAEPIVTYISHRPDVPLGSRSLKYDLAGGSAVGSQHAVASMAATTVAGLSVLAPEGSTGVAYAGYQAPEDRGTNLVWVGRAPLVAAPGGWQPVEAAPLAYEWTRYDLDARQPVDPAEPASVATTVPDFLAAHGGDGPGFYAVGFGCDGQPFQIDALRIGAPGQVTTYDLEGFTSVTGITGPARPVTAGDEVSLGGSLRVAQGDTPARHGRLVLESKPYGADAFSPVEDGAAEGPDVTVSVTPTVLTEYRWSFIGSWSLDGSLSPTITVPVVARVAAVLDDPGLADGAPLVVSGTATPASPGTPAVLWRVTPRGGGIVARTPIAEDGAFRFEVPTERAGAGTYVVRVPARAGNLPGESAPLLVHGPR